MSAQPPAPVSQAGLTAWLGSAPIVPALIATAGDQAMRRFLEFFAVTIRNSNARRAYGRACGDFLAWCAETGVQKLAAVQPLHVATWAEMQTRSLAAPSVKQHLAAVRHLFDWLVTGQVVPVNPAASVRRRMSCARARLRCWSRARPARCSKASMPRPIPVCATGR
jgi:hypothetical protein